MHYQRNCRPKGSFPCAESARERERYIYIYIYCCHICRRPRKLAPFFLFFWCFMCFNYIKHQKHQLTQDRGYGHNNPSPDPPNKQNKTKNLLRKLNQPRGSLSLSLCLSLYCLCFLGLLGPFGSIDPENKDTFDIFNVSPVLSVFFRMLKFYCGLGDILGKMSPKQRGNFNIRKKMLKTGEMLKTSKLSRFPASIGPKDPNRRGKP